MFYSCKEEKDCCVNPVTNVTINFTHNWDGTPVSKTNFNQFIFTNAHGEKVSIEKLRYLISNVSLNSSKNYQLIDVTENTGTSIVFPNLTTETYSLSFTFGFNDVDNKDGVYQDLNSASFNVPAMLGGGYHFMQFDGKYKDVNNQDANFNYHAIRAVDASDASNLVFQDTSFTVNLGEINITNNTTVEIKMNIAEWFKNPNTWNLNQLNTVLMPNFEAQKMINANGKSVFSLGKVN